MENLLKFVSRSGVEGKRSEGKGGVGDGTGEIGRTGGRGTTGGLRRTPGERKGARGRSQKIRIVLLLFIFLDSSKAAKGPFDSIFVGRVLKDSFVTIFTEETSSCSCRVECSLTPECTALSVVTLDNGKVACYHSDKTVFEWNSTDQQTSAVTYFQPGIQVQQLTPEQEREMYSLHLTLQATSATANAGANTTTTTSQNTLSSSSTTSTTPNTTPETATSTTTTTTTEAATTTSTTTTTTTTTVPCDSPYEFVESLGCLNLVEEEKSFGAARQYCQNEGGDLYVAPSEEKFGTLISHVRAENIQNQIWVGVQSRKWLDDRSVGASEWGTGEPNEDMTTCARMYDGDNFKLWDRECSYTYWFLCQK